MCDERAGRDAAGPLEMSHGGGAHWTWSARSTWSVQVLSEPATIAAIASSTFFWMSGVMSAREVVARRDADALGLRVEQDVAAELVAGRELLDHGRRSRSGDASRRW